MAQKLQSWGKYLSWYAEEVYSPSTLDELRYIIQIANSRGANIRVGGSFHTLNSLFVSKHVQILSDNLNKILSLNKARMLVKVEGGIKQQDLLEALAKEGLTLPCQSYILKQSVAGLIATATHGTGKTGSICSIVEELELLDYNGVLHRLSPDKNSHLFNAALVNLGCMGIIYSITFRCVPRFKLSLKKYEQRLEDTLKEIPRLLQEYDNVLIHINPYKRLAYPSCYKITEEPPQGKVWSFLKWCVRKTIAFVSMNLPWYPPNFLIPPFLNLFLKASVTKKAVDYNSIILSPSDDGNWVEEEFFVTIEHLQEALEIVLKIIEKHAANGEVMVVPVTLRFVGADRYGYLSPFYAESAVAISVVAIPKSGYEKVFREMEAALLPLNARPHWGKIHFLDKDTILKLYGSHVLLFNSARKELDPLNIFSNHYIDNLL